jgi:hypothetical protein
MNNKEEREQSDKNIYHFCRANKFICPFGKSSRKKFYKISNGINFVLYIRQACWLLLPYASDPLFRIKEFNMKKILWFSRHPMMEFQRPILQKIFGNDFELEQMIGRDAYISAEKIVDYMKRNKFDEIVMVAPLSVMAKVIELGIKPIKADVVEVKDSREATFSYNGRHYKFLKFVRVVKLELVTENL